MIPEKRLLNTLYILGPETIHPHPGKIYQFLEPSEPNQPGEPNQSKPCETNHKSRETLESENQLGEQYWS